LIRPLSEAQLYNYAAKLMFLHLFKLKEGFTEKAQKKGSKIGFDKRMKLFGVGQLPRMKIIMYF